MFTKTKMRNTSRNRNGEYAKSDYKITQRRKRLSKIFILELAVLTTLFIWLADLTAEKVANALYPSIQPVEAQILASKALIEPSIEEYVFEEVKRELGLNEAIKAVSMIGGCENPEWKPDICIIEPNNSISCGIWMINTVHNRKDSSNYISNADKLDYKKATEWAIQKRIKDGSWEAWSCN